MCSFFSINFYFQEVCIDSLIEMAIWNISGGFFLRPVKMMPMRTLQNMMVGAFLSHEN